MLSYRIVGQKEPVQGALRMLLMVMLLLLLVLLVLCERVW